MSAPLVTLVNPNLVHPPITPYALDILTTSLEDAGFDVEVLDLTFQRDQWRAAIGRYFADRRPLLVGVTVRNTDTIYPQQQRVFLPVHKQIIDRVAACTDAPIVAGGVGFSSMPVALVDYFNIEYGVKGPGERTIVELARALHRGEPVATTGGLVVNHGNGDVRIAPSTGLGAVDRVSAYRRRSGLRWRVDNAGYYQRGGLGNILTKNGCPFACSHCVEPDAKGNRFALRAETAVVDEMESLCAQGVYDLHTTDSEFNLNPRHVKTVLREIIARRGRGGSPLRRLRLWIYVQPAPFDAEFADLLAEAGCAGINVAPDHVRDDLLDGWKVTRSGKRYYGFDDVSTLCGLARERGIPTMVEVLLGMPGETIQTLHECVDRTLGLDATVTGYTLGIRAFPYSPLGRWLAERCAGVRTVPGLQSNTATAPIVLAPRSMIGTLAYERQFMFDADGAIRPVYYFSPDLPESADTIGRPDGRRHETLRALWDRVPDAELHRVMLPTGPGLSKDDNNYADNPFLITLTRLGYKGAYWSHWPDRDEIMLRDARALAR